MGDFIQYIEGMRIAEFVRSSPSIFGYTSVLTLHAIGLAVVVGIGGAVSLRLLGYGRGIPVPPLLRLFPVIWVGFTINALSGLALLAANASSLLANTIFLVKLGLIALAVVNMELLRHRVAVLAPALAGRDGEIDSQTRVLALSSLVLWLAVLVTGRLTAYPNLVSGVFT